MAKKPRKKSASTHAGTPRYDTAEVRAAANGRWAIILQALAGISADILDGDHHPCPKPSCGGTDRFRFTDMNGDGSALCNVCGKGLGDGFAVLGWLTGKKFVECLAMVADYLGIEPTTSGHAGRGSGSRDFDPAEHLKFLPWSELTAAYWCLSKPPITAAAILACGGRLAIYRNQWKVIALPVWGEHLDSPDPATNIPREPVGWCMYAAQPGGLLPKFPKPGVEDRSIEWVKVKLAAGSKPGIIADLSRLASPTTSTIWKLEGPTDLLAFLSLPDLPPDVTAITNANGCSEQPAAWMLELFAGKSARVLGDADSPGQAGAIAWAGPIASKADDCSTVELPYEIEPTHGRDLRDFAADPAGGSYAALAALPSTPAIPADLPPSKDGKPKVVIGVDEHRVIDEAVAALASDDHVFRRGTMLVTIVRDTEKPKGIKRPENSPRISAIPLPIIRERLTANMRWIQLKEVEGVMEEFPAHPPMWAVNAVNARGQWKEIRRLEGVVESPVIRYDGSVLSEPGYDPITGLYYAPNCEMDPLGESLSIEDAKQAVETLKEVVVDFPFDKESHRSAWFASVLTPFARFAYEGPTPLFLVEANTPGTGKGLLCDTISHLTLGREMSRMSYPSDDDEMRKNITATAIAGDRTVLIDNVGGNFGSPALDAMLTAGTWRDRMLGRSETTGDIPLSTIWYATGNNLILVGDIARRICPIRLNSPLEKPEERTDFHHADLLVWVHRQRGGLMRACMTILKAYIDSGRPNQNLTPWGSYTGWSSLVRSAVVWAGLPDPAGAKTELRSQSDRGIGVLKMIIDGMNEFDPDGMGKTVSEMLKVFTYPEGRYEILKSALAELGGKKTITPHSVGMKLHHLKERVCGGKCICRLDGSIVKWFVVDVEAEEKNKNTDVAVVEKNKNPMFDGFEQSDSLLDSLP